MGLPSIDLDNGWLRMKECIYWGSPLFHQALELLLVLWNSCPYTISPTFSSPPMPHRTSPLTNSLPLWTNTRTYPHSSQTPPSPRWNSVPFLDVCFSFHLSCLDPFRSSTGPSVRWSLFHISYAFPFSFRSCSALRYTALAFRSISLLVSYHSLFLLSHWLSDVEAYPESYLELQSNLCSVLYKVTQPLVCSLASSTQSSLVSSLPGLPEISLVEVLLSLRITSLGCCDSS